MRKNKGRNPKKEKDGVAKEMRETIRKEERGISTGHKQFVCIKNATNGITLVALVVTIVIMLILGGITIAVMMSPNGIIGIAQGLKAEQMKADFEEEIRLVNIQMQMKKQLNNGKITAGDYFEELKNQGMIKDTEVGGDNIKEKGETKEGDTIYEVTTEKGDVFELVIDKDSNISIEYQGPADSLPPRIKSFTVKTITTNSIEVETEVSRQEDAKLTYEYREHNESKENDYTELKKDTTDLTAEYTGLKSKTYYDLKVTIQGKKGKDEKVIEKVYTEELRAGTITQKGSTIWSEGKATIELQTSETGYTIQYQKGSTTGTWEKYEGPIGNLNHGDKVFARIYDGTNGSAETMIIINDGVPPTVTLSTGTVTTKSIQVTAGATDSESGMPSTRTYKYYIKKNIETAWPTTVSYSGSDTSYTFNNLDDNTGYDVKVTTEDNARNTGEKTITGIQTVEVGGATPGLKTGNITAGEVSWNSSTHTASVTLNTTTGLRIEYKKGSSDSWHTAAEGTSSITVTGISNNTVLIARLTDGRNTGSEASITVIDGEDPQEATISLSTRNTSAGATITATVTHTDNESGVAIGSCKYIYDTTSTKLGKTNTAWNSATAFTSNGQTINLVAPTGGTSYYLHVLTVDNAGNKEEKLSDAVTVTTPVTGVSLNQTSATMEIGATLQLTATVSPSNATNKAVTWSSSNSTAASVDSNGLVTALAAGSATITVRTNDGSKTATCNVTVNATEEVLVSFGGQTLHVGDYINYDCKTTASYTKNNDYSVGYYTHPYGKGFYSMSYTYGWRVLGKDSNGQLLIISEELVPTSERGVTTTTRGQLTLKGVHGYNNGVTILNDIGAVYGKGPKATGGRSVNSNDISNLSGISENSKAYKMLYLNSSTGANSDKAGTTDGMKYWLATISSTGVGSHGHYSYYIGIVQNGTKGTFQSVYGDEAHMQANEYTETAGVRPVVSIGTGTTLKKSTTQKDGCNLWEIQ